MADTFDSRLKLRLQESGANSGQWGTLLNQTVTNIASVFGFGTHQLTSDADATLTLSDDGASLDALKSSYLKITSSVSLTATRTLTFAPNTFNQVKYIENATTGSQSLVIKQGSGATVTVASGKTAVVYFTGSGSDAAVVDALAGVDPGVTDTLAEVLAAGNATGGTDIAVGTGDDVTFADNAKAIFGTSGDGLEIYHDSNNSYIKDSGTGDLIIQASDDLKLQTASGTNMAVFTENTYARLFYNGTARFETTNTGIDVTGSVTADAVNIAAASAPTFKIENTDTSLGNAQTLGDIDFFQSDPSGDGAGVVSKIRSVNESSFQGLGALAFQTGTTSTLTERFRIGSGGDISFFDTSGNAAVFFDASAAALGIGTTAMSSYFAKNLVVMADGDGTGGITIAAPATDDTTYLAFADGTSGAATFAGYIAYAHSGDDLLLGAGGATRVTIDSSSATFNGAVTTGATITVNSGSLNLASDGGTLFIGADIDMRLTHDGSNGTFRCDTGDMTFDVAGDIILDADGTEAMRITSSGALQMAGTGTDNDSNAITFVNGACAIARDANNLEIHAFDNLIFGVSNTSYPTSTERMRIDSNGNVGIGCSPSRELEVAGSGNVYIKVTAPTANDSAGLELANTGATWLIQNDDTSSEALTFDRAGVEAARIDSSGNLLVGTTDTLPAINNVEGIALSAGSFGGRLEVSRAGAEPVSINRKTDDGSLISFKKDGTTVGSIGVDFGDRLFIQTGDTGLFFNNASDAIQPYGSGDLRDNAIDLGSSGYRFDDIFATNGTIQTSDRNEKQDIEALSDAEQRVAVAAKGLLRKFRWKSSVEEKGDDARIHFGIIAQDLQDTFTAEGLDAARYAMFCSDTWTDEETGDERTRLGVRYSELLAFIISAI